MARDSSGTYSLPAGNPVVSGTTIEASWANTTLTDIGDEMTNSLDRTGKGGMTGALKLADGTVSAPGVSFVSESNTGLYRASAGNVRISVLGSDVLTVTGSALTPAVPFSTIDVNGGTIDGTVIGGTTPAAISGTTGTFSGNVTGANLAISNWNTAFGWGDWSTGVDKAFVDALNVDADTLDGNDSTAFATAAQGALADTSVQPGDDAADLGSGAATDGHVLTADGVGGAAFEVIPTPTLDAVTGAGATTTNAVTVGNATVSRLDVGTPTVTNAEINLDDSSFDTTPTDVTKINLLDTGAGVRYGFGVSAAQLNYRAGTSADAHVFYAGTTERARIDSSGNLIVGTTASNPIISQATGARIGGGNFNIYNPSGVAIATGRLSNGQNHIEFFVNGANYAGGISASTLATPSFVSPSDRRLKENIRDREGELRNIMSLRPVVFDWKDGRGVDSIGFIAQEVEPVYPDLVSVSDDGYKQLSDMGPMVTRLVKAIQELKAELDELKQNVGTHG